jgi:hypothetical protein
MSKTTEKILMSPINALVWTSHNPAETILISVFIFSTFPFLGIHIGSIGFLGGLLGFFGMISQKYIFKYEKTTDSFNIIGIILLIIGVISIFFVGDKKTGDSWSNTELSLNIYFGTFFGMMLSVMIISFNDDRMKEKERIKEEEERIEVIRRINIAIRVKESQGFIAIRDNNGSLTGYVEKEKYNDFINQNLIKGEHEQGKENKA